MISDSNANFPPQPMGSLTVDIQAPSDLRWSGALPVQVRDVYKLGVAATSVSDRGMSVPAGRYLVTALLPNGELLVLERVVGTFGLSAKIFRAERRGASDIAKIRALEGADYKPAGKTLLFSRATLTNNFEGIALGPKLADGWRSLILIADSGGGTTHFLMPLRIRWSAE